MLACFCCKYFKGVQALTKVSKLLRFTIGSITVSNNVVYACKTKDFHMRACFSVIFNLKTCSFAMARPLVY